MRYVIFLLIAISMVLIVTCTFNSNVKPAVEEISPKLNPLEYRLETFENDVSFALAGTDVSPDNKQSTTYQIARNNNVGRITTERNMPSIFSAVRSDCKTHETEEKIAFNALVENVTSPNSYLLLDFENDIFANTDYYFTHGASIGFIHPSFQTIFPNFLFPNAGKSTVNHYGISIRQNIYTGVNPESTAIDENDRPFAGTLFFDFYKVSTNHHKQLRLISGLQMGVIGPASLASTLQSSLHEKFPTGWDFQITNDVLINYNLKLEKRIFNRKSVDLTYNAIAQIGTHQTALGTGLSLRLGGLPFAFNFFPISQANTFEYIKNTHRFPIWFFANASIKAILHDATLFGGLFNKNRPYVVSRSSTNSINVQIATGIEGAIGRSLVSLKLVYLSPEIKTGTAHRWGAIGFIHNL